MMIMMNVEEFYRNLTRMELKLKEALNKDIPIIIGNEAVTQFKQNFQTESFFGEQWKEVKRRQQPVAKGAAGMRKILTGNTGNLGRSIQYKVGIASVTVYSDVVYAKAHNEGTISAGRRRSTTIPKRQFIGMHPKLSKAIENKIDMKLNEILR